MRRFMALRSRDMVLITAGAMFMAQLDGAVLVIALPHIAQDFGLPVVSLSLAVTIYLTMLVAVLPVSGWAADRFGAKRVFLTATLGFAVFSLACAVSGSFWPFIISRALQGACAALLAPVGRLILLRETSKDELVDALAIAAMPMLIAPTFGPSLGGFIVDFASWELIFLLNLPISALLLTMGWRRIPAMKGDSTLPLDKKGALLLSAGLIILLTGFDRLVGGIAHPLPWALVTAGSVLFAAAVFHLRSHPAPIVRLDALRNPAFRTTAWGAGAVIRLPARAVLFALPLMFQMGFGFSPFVAGLLLIALNGGDFVAKPWVKPAFDRFGYRATMVASSLAGLVAMAVFVLATPGPVLLPLLVGALFLSGIARSLVFTGMSSLTYATLSQQTMTSGNVLASMSMQLFNTLSVSITALLLSLFAGMAHGGEPVLADYRYTLGTIALIGLASTLMLYRKLPHDLHEVHPKASPRP